MDRPVSRGAASGENEPVTASLSCDPADPTRAAAVSDSGEVERLLAFDRAHVWHPYSSALRPSVMQFAESASGVRLRLRINEGRDSVEVIDAMASWWCAIHGYGVPELDEAARRQLDSMSHVMFGGITHAPAVRLAQQLIDLAPGAPDRKPDGAAVEDDNRLQHVFFADSGSVSVEVALKAAWQYHALTGTPRRRIFTIRGGYHGDTFGAMSVCDPVGGMHSLFTGVLPEQIFAPRPPAGVDRALDDPELLEWERATRALYAAHADDIAGVICEPVLQGAGGMHAYSPHAVRVLAELAASNDALFILDEIATGFGRTGTFWAADRCDVVPDILCVGKALTGGYASMAAMLCTPKVARGVSAEPAGALMHGPTFMGNPMVAAIAGASLSLLQRDDPLARVARIEDGLTAALAPAKEFASVSDVRTLGAVGVIQLREPVDAARVAAVALDHGVWVRPFRDCVYTMPPFVTEPEDIASIGAALVEAVGQVHGR
ncbi:adenosylmethionine--8-amino-7-oxononanoate transaminase [Gephyromycinifex aptenodytis]|uniref:adenosylmethionine--8-amino-7-oxononanoate transaminase n=1 Tax=Gephyromycinifex aptenodytis TaxID=2716227 RepID=UPI00144655CD|nr:adenosylmethionine--8-amino-7-oxononanoate transaminase [Gephyromycinifex aptenodytis]